MVWQVAKASKGRVDIEADAEAKESLRIYNTEAGLFLFISLWTHQEFLVTLECFSQVDGLAQGKFSHLVESLGWGRLRAPGLGFE